MTFQSLGWAWGIPLPPAEKLVLLYLADGFDADYQGPQQFDFDNLAWFAGLDQAGLHGVLSALEHRGLAFWQRDGEAGDRYWLPVRGTEPPSFEPEPVPSLWERARMEFARLRPTLAPIVYERDGRRCRTCGTEQPPLHIDHIIPLYRGGSNDLGNLQVLCRPCNSRKGTRINEAG